MFKPMLACSTIPRLEDLKYPVYASPKLDGIRCLIVDGKPVSRTLKPIPNLFIQRELEKLNLPKLDGELMLLDGDFNKVQSAVMSVHGEPNFCYKVFDCFEYPALSYQERLDRVYDKDIASSRVHYVYNEVVVDAERMQVLYSEWLAHGYEGAIVRDVKGPYKYGRSTMNQGWMLKLKVFRDDEALIVGVEELMHNDNEQHENELGDNVRSSHRENQRGGDTLGALVVEYNNVVFKIGTGFTAAERSMLWAIRKEILGEQVTFKYQELSSYGKPRFPVYKGIRYERV